MKHIIFRDAETYPIAILVKESAFKEAEIASHYAQPIVDAGIQGGLIAFTLKYNDSGKAPAGFIKDYLTNLLGALYHLGTQYLLVTDAAYFKVLTGKTKADPCHGYVLPCKIKGYEHMNVVLSLNYQSLIYNPELASKLQTSVNTLIAAVQGTYQDPGTGIIHSAQYPKTHEEIRAALEKLHQYPALTCDIEGFSLSFDRAGIGTIAFAWDEHNGIAFSVDYLSYYEMQTVSDLKGIQGSDLLTRELLREFFETYQGELIFHSGSYDLKAIIYNLWMDSLLDTKGLLHGLEVMTRRFHDTKIIAYLATNSTAGNVLGLKPLAQEFAGNWAKDDIKDIRRIPYEDLLRYNLVDCLSTWYVYKKYYPIMVQDQQEELYKGLMLDSQKMLIQVEMTGMPLNEQKVRDARAKLEAIRQGHENTLTSSSIIKMFDLIVQRSKMEKANAKLKKKQHPLEKFADEKFNPNSNPQVRELLYENICLPVIDTTDTGLPATGGDTLKKLINHTDNPEYQALLQALIGYAEADKILGTFIKAFEESLHKGTYPIVWLHGSFNIGGTVSGRLSSSDPNLQNLPAKSTFGKLIKECFVAPEGWIFCGADFNSLEDYISALTTKDPNKLKVYLDGFDGHALRAVFYFRDQLPDIDPEDPNSVNVLKTEDHPLRQESKAPTFALTYGGTYHTLMNNLGWSEEKARAIEANYHELYKVSDEYVRQRLEQASRDGYVDVAFGLRLRTPLLKQVIFGSSKMPYEAAAEGRTAGNALGQSYGLLNNRAAVAFMKKVWASPYREYIKPVALIHDAIYLLILDHIDVVTWVNRELISEMRWQELPEIQHDKVKLGAALDLYWPSWADPITLPNDADADTIRATVNKELEKRKQP